MKSFFYDTTLLRNLQTRLIQINAPAYPVNMRKMKLHLKQRKCQAKKYYSVAGLYSSKLH